MSRRGLPGLITVSGPVAPFAGSALLAIRSMMLFDWTDKHTYVWMNVRANVRMPIRMFVRTFVWLFVRMFVRTHIGTYIRLNVQMFVKTHLQTLGWTFERSFVWTYDCLSRQPWNRRRVASGIRASVQIERQPGWKRLLVVSGFPTFPKCCPTLPDFFYYENPMQAQHCYIYEKRKAQESLPPPSWWWQTMFIGMDRHRYYSLEWCGVLYAHLLIIIFYPEVFITVSYAQTCMARYVNAGGKSRKR